MYSSGIASTKPIHRKDDYAITSVIPYCFEQGTSHIIDPITAMSYREAMFASGVAITKDRLDQTMGTSFADMAKTVMLNNDGLSAELVVLAHSTPDLIPSDAPVIDLLALQRPAAAAAFTVCDVSPLIAFTAIDLARQFAARQGYRRVLVLLAENSTFPYEPRVTEMQAVLQEAAVLLVIEPSNTWQTVIERESFVDWPESDSIASILLKFVRDVSRRDLPNASEMLWVLAFGLRGYAGLVEAESGAEVIVSSAGQPTTAVWRDMLLNSPKTGPLAAVLVELDMDAEAMAACRLTMERPVML